MAPPTSLRILVVDDEVGILVTLSACLETDGHRVVACATAAEAMLAVAQQAFDLIFLDLRLGTEDGLEYIGPLLRFNPWAKVVVITAYASIETAVAAMKRGAADYLPKPFTPAQVELVTRAVAQRRQLELQLEMLQADLGDDPDADFPTVSTAMRSALELARTVAGTRAPVLIGGEPGTAKQRLARAVHAWSDRAAGPCAVASCVADDAAALDAQLFGLAAAAGGHLPPELPGRVAFCDGGTLILDEISELPPSLQPKVERLITQASYERQDDFSPRQANVRLVATSSADLSELAARHRFRQELLLALDVVRIDLPPLRERPQDVPLLAERYLAHYRRQHHRSIAGFSNHALHALAQHDWPGNERELRNLVERAVILCDADLICARHFPPNFLGPSAAAYVPGDLVSLQTIEDLHVRRVIEAAGTIKGAASILGINYTTLWRRLRRNNGDPAEPPDDPGNHHDESAH